MNKNVKKALVVDVAVDKTTEDKHTKRKKMSKRNILLVGLGLTICYFIWSQCYRYNNVRACEYVAENALDRSHCCCAWFVMRAMQEGGCPIGILPAWAYKFALPFYGFREVYSDIGRDCSPRHVLKRGDIVVIPKGTYSFWGHIAMYDGNQWVSDFKQRHMSPYRKPVKYRIYRHYK